MDPFTQRMLEKAEQRSRALGISSAAISKFPLCEPNSSSNVGTGTGACATTMASQQQKQRQQHQLQQQQQQQRQQHQLQQQQQQQRQQLPLHTNVSSGSSSGGNFNKLHIIEKQAMETTAVTSSAGATSPQKILRQFSAVDKENMDLGIEINIMTDKNVEVQVQVEEQNITDDESHQHNVYQSQLQRQPIEGLQHTTTQPIAKLRDTSRNRLQRLGALYSDADNLSSPIHRTEGNFHAGGNDESVLDSSKLRKPKQRLDKLTALANTIHQWEDDTSHHSLTICESSLPAPPPKPELSSRGRVRPVGKMKGQAPKPPTDKYHDDNKALPTNEKDKTKQLKWDPKVLNSLEAQGFQRRESSSVKVSYDFANDKEDDDEQCQDTPSVISGVQNEQPKDEKRIVGRLNTNKFGSALVNATEENKSTQVERKVPPNVKPGLVSGRAAIFESQYQANQQQHQQKPPKDPTELSLKERMKLFEKNKGEALIPKAAFGMAPSISKILQDTQQKKDDYTKAPSTKIASTNVISSTNPHSANILKTNANCKVRDKVTALVNATTENKIQEDIRKQREEDMQVLANRFNKQKDLFSQQQPHQTHHQQIHANASQVKNTRPHVAPPPPPPPPMPININLTAKRRSPGNVIEDETKRPRKSNQEAQRLYPALSDLESNASYGSDNAENCCTTATASALSTADEMKSTEVQPLRGHHHDDADNNEPDDENEDSYMESEDEDSSVGICNGSLGREIMQVVKKNDKHGNKIKEVRYADKDHYFGDTTVDSSINSSELSMGVDDYLDEALDENVDDGDDDITQDDEEDDENNSRLSRGSKGTTASNSFSFRKANTTMHTNCETIDEENNDFKIATTSSNTTTSSSSSSSYMQPVKSELSVNKESDNVVTLVHTVSFYRRQQSANSANSTPIRKICREHQVLRSAMKKLDAKGAGGSAMASLHFNPDTAESDEANLYDSEADDANLVQDKINKLLDEVCKQQQVIAQTSQALNLCAATVEFSGSTESVEGERHLLVATHRRQACLDEVQRLRVEKSLRPLGAPSEKGCLTVKEITIPLRQEYIRKLAADTISGHHLVCLLKYNEHVLATKTVPTLPGLLAVKFPDILQLNSVYADFKVTLEIYGMTAQREVLPHEVKYHINLNKKSGIKTPKKKGGDNRLVMPPVQSPAGPHVVRTPALVQYGFAIFSLREIQRTTWTLTRMLGVSPLEGVVHMKVNCELSVSVEHKGFLTMFEDISGFGAWHRRWCHLNGTILNCWKYPDDEKKKAPLGTIDLYTCSSQRVSIAPRDICARLNTMLLECQRLAKETDQESLIIVPNGRTTIVRYLLSADTKEEREEWCAYFNKTLTLLRAWGPPQ